MNEKDILKNKSFDFAVRIIHLYQYLCESKKEYILSKQILRSWTSIGANVREAKNAESSMDFIHKLWISQKEADETLYWLELLYTTWFLSEIEYTSLSSDATALLKMIRSSIITKKKNIS